MPKDLPMPREVAISLVEDLVAAVVEYEHAEVGERLRSNLLQEIRKCKEAIISALVS